MTQKEPVSGVSFTKQNSRNSSSRSGNVNNHDAGLEVAKPDSILDMTPLSWHPQYGVHIGWSAIVLILVIGGLGAVAFISQLNLVFWSAALASAVLFVSVLVPNRMIYPVRVTKTPPSNGVINEPMSIRYDVHNTRRSYGVYSLRLAELTGKGQCIEQPRIYIPYIGPGETVTFQLLVTPAKRGRLRLWGTRLASRYPFGLMTRFSTVADTHTVTIYPATGKLSRKFLPGHRMMDVHTGLKANQYRGESDEFYALREYRQGDNPKHIHWKRSAKMNQLVVREMSQFVPQRLTVILDTHMSDFEPATLNRFEKAVSFAATLVCDSLEEGYRAALICCGPEPVLIPPLAGREAQHRVLRTLSMIEAQNKVGLSDAVHGWRWTSKWRGKCIVVSMKHQSANVMDRLGEAIGPAQVIVAGEGDWNRLFRPPEYLKNAEPERI